jgi:hypothetical protein
MNQGEQPLRSDKKLADKWKWALSSEFKLDVQCPAISLSERGAGDRKVLVARDLLFFRTVLRTTMQYFNE